MYPSKMMHSLSSLDRSHSQFRTAGLPMSWTKISIVIALEFQILSILNLEDVTVSSHSKFKKNWKNKKKCVKIYQPADADVFVSVPHKVQKIKIRTLEKKNKKWSVAQTWKMREEFDSFLSSNAQRGCKLTTIEFRILTEGALSLGDRTSVDDHRCICYFCVNRECVTEIHTKTTKITAVIFNRNLISSHHFSLG